MVKHRNSITGNLAIRALTDRRFVFADSCSPGEMIEGESSARISQASHGLHAVVHLSQFVQTGRYIAIRLVQLRGR